MITPKNGLFIDRPDFEEFQNSFLSDYVSKDEVAAIRSADFNSGCEYGFTSNPIADQMIRTITFVVTEKCNLACTYCYETHKTNDRMTKEVGKAAVDLLFDQERLNGFMDIQKVPAIILDFIGGEPFLEIDLMDYIVEYFKFKAFDEGHPWAYNYMISISTNGTLYRSKKVQQFMERNKGRVSTTVSIDGNKDLHDACRVYRNGRGSYDKVAEAVEKWVGDNCSHVSTKATIAPENIRYLEASIKHLFEDLHIGGIYGGFTYDKGWKIQDAAEGYPILKNVARWLLETGGHKRYYLGFFDRNIGNPRQPEDDQNFCGGSGAMLAISAKGKAAPCLRFLKYTLERREEKIIGNVENGLDSIEENKWLGKLNAITMTSQSPPKCQACPVTMGCGGCTAYNYDYSGSPDVKMTFSCKMHRTRVLANVYYWNNIYKMYNIKQRYPLNMPLSWALEIIPEEEYWELYELANGERAAL